MRFAERIGVAGGRLRIGPPLAFFMAFALADWLGWVLREHASESFVALSVPFIQVEAAGTALAITLAAVICFGLIRNEVVALLAGSLLYLVLWIPLSWVTNPLLSSGRATRFEIFWPSAGVAFQVLLWPLLCFAALAFGFASAKRPWLRVTLAWFLATALRCAAILALSAGEHRALSRDSFVQFALIPIGFAALELMLLWAGLEIANAGRGKLARWPAGLILWAGGLTVPILLTPCSYVLGHGWNVGSGLAVLISRGRLESLAEIFTLGRGAWFGYSWEGRIQAVMLPLGVLLPLAQLAGLCALIYLMWRAIQDGRPRTSPGKALGFLFIPFFNLYWFFQVTWGFARDFNAHLDRQGLRTRRLSEGLLLAYPILTIVSSCLIGFTRAASLAMTLMWLAQAAVGAAVTSAVNEATRNAAAESTSAAAA
jgi:hypothetical protein